MSHILKWAVLFFIATLLASVALYDNGLISLVWQDYIIETSASFFLIAIILGFALLYFLIRLIINLWHMPKYWRNRQRMKRYAKAETAMEKGLISIEYGDWKSAENHMLRSAKQSDLSLMYFLSAAKMAYNQIGKNKDAEKRCYQYLENARENYPQQYLIIGLVEARIRAQKDPDMALIILDELYRMHPKHQPLLKEFALVLADFKQWKKLEAIWPDLFKSKALEKSEMMSLEIRLKSGKLMQAKDLDQLSLTWDSFSSALQRQNEILAAYVDKKMAFDDALGLADLIEKSLKKEFSERLVYQYGRIQFGPAFERLKVAEKWHHRYPNNPVVLLTLGRLACQSQLWGQGQKYLKQSLAMRSEVETYHALAECYEAEGLNEKAALTYREAMLSLNLEQKII